MGQMVNVIQSVFNRGELSPRIIGRLDLDAYYNALKSSTNFIPFPQGAITKRNGTYYVADVKDSADQTILIPFRFSTVQNYIIEAGDLYFRFYRNRGQVESAPSTPYELTTPWPESVLNELKFVQSYDRLYVFHKDYQTRVITRTGDTAWTIANLSFTDGPFLPTNATAITLTPSAATGAITVTASSSLFVAGDVGRQIRMKQGAADWGYMTITAYTSATQVSATVNKNLGGTGAVTTWNLSYFGGTLGWPSVGTIYEQRFIMANTASYPATLFASETGAFSDSVSMSPTNASGAVVDSNGFVYTIGDDQVNAIEWLSSGRILMIGTSGAEHSMTGGTSSSYAPVSPSNVTIKRETKVGSRSGVRAHRVGNAILYTSKSGLKARELNYDFGIDSYISRDITIFNDHITQSGIVDCDFQDEPDPTLWCVREDGKLIGFSYEREQQVEGWHKHTIGGVDSAVKRVACIPKPDGSGDDLWMIVSRTIGGNTVQSIEYMTDYYSPEIYGKASSFFVDSGLTYDGRFDATLTPAATTGTGIVFTAGSSVFTAGMVGDQIRAGAGRAIITGYSSGTSVTATITVAFASTSAVASGDWSIATKDIVGLTRVNGETVSVCADGYYAGDKVVSGGGFTLDDYASIVHAGFGYSSELKTLPVELKSLGTIAGRTRRTHEVNIYLTNTIGLRLGNEGNSVIEVVPFGGGNENLNEGPSLYNGILTREPPLDYDKEGVLNLSHIWPTNITVNYIAQKLTING